MGIRRLISAAYCLIPTAGLMLLGCGDDSSGATTASGGASTGAGTGGSATAGSGGQGGAGNGTAGGSGGDGGAGGEEVDPFSTDKSQFFGESRCGDLNVMLCDDFEDGEIDPGLWKVLGATPTLDSTRAARGDQSVHFHTVQNGFSRLEHTASFPAPNNRYWGRMFVWIEAMPTAPNWAHWTLVGADGSDIAGEIRVGGQFHPPSGKNLFGVGTDGGATGDWTNLDDDPNGEALTVTEGDWMCVEWMHDSDAQQGAFYWDAVEHPSLQTSATMHGGNQNADYIMPTIDSLWIGWWLYQGGTTPNEFDIWIDEIALDSERIGCVR